MLKRCMSHSTLQLPEELFVQSLTIFRFAPRPFHSPNQHTKLNGPRSTDLAPPVARQPENSISGELFAQTPCVRWTFVRCASDGGTRGSVLKAEGPGHQSGTKVHSLLAPWSPKRDFEDYSIIPALLLINCFHLFFIYSYSPLTQLLHAHRLFLVHCHFLLYDVHLFIPPFPHLSLLAVFVWFLASWFKYIMWSYNTWLIHCAIIYSYCYLSHHMFIKSFTE